MLRFRLLTLALALVAVAGCNTDRADQLAKENQELKAQIAKTNTTHSLDLQAKCSAAAKSWFAENWGGSSPGQTTLLLTEHNHYNQSSNRCFIVVEYNFKQNSGSSWATTMSLWDVYENIQDGDFSSGHSVNYKGENEETQLTCEVLNKKCNSADEFNSLIDSYMND